MKCTIGEVVHGFAFMDAQLLRAPDDTSSNLLLVDVALLSARHLQGWGTSTFRFLIKDVHNNRYFTGPRLLLDENTGFFLSTRLASSAPELSFT